MRWWKTALITAVFACVCAGCASVNYEEKYTFGPTRKLMDSGAPGAAKKVFSPLVFIPDTISVPITAYRDAAAKPPEAKGGHVYLSYIGTRTTMYSDLKPVYKWTGGVVIAIVDTLWFPVAGLVDTIYAVNYW